jgi:hypothetical protein
MATKQDVPLPLNNHEWEFIPRKVDHNVGVWRCSKCLLWAESSQAREKSCDQGAELRNAVHKNLSAIPHKP